MEAGALLIVRLIVGVEDDGSSIAYIDAEEGTLPLGDNDWQGAAAIGSRSAAPASRHRVSVWPAPLPPAALPLTSTHLV